MSPTDEKEIFAKLNTIKAIVITLVIIFIFLVCSYADYIQYWRTSGPHVVAASIVDNTYRISIKDTTTDGMIFPARSFSATDLWIVTGSKALSSNFVFSGIINKIDIFDILMHHTPDQETVLSYLSRHGSFTIQKYELPSFKYSKDKLDHTFKITINNNEINNKYKYIISFEDTLSTGVYILDSPE